MVGIAVYTTGLAEALVQRGHTVEVVAGKPYYPTWSVPVAFRGGWRRKSFEHGVALTRVAHYVPAKPSGLKRLVHHASFALSSLIPTLLAARRMRPDFVLTIAPSLIAAPVAKLAATVSGAKSWLHIQDFEVEAAFATGLLSRDQWIGRWAEHFERTVIGNFDYVSTISPQMCAKLKSKGFPAELIAEFRNWADIDAIRPLNVPSPYRAEWNITTPHVALYSGNIANKQGIDIVVDAAKRLEYRNDLTFVICGEGPNRDRIRVQAAGLSNIQFQDLQPKERLSDLVGLATIHLLPQLESAADLVLPSKLTNMLASGRPVVATASPGTGLAVEVDGCGLVTAPEDGAAFAAAIERLMDEPELYADMAACARRRAETHWSGGAILQRLTEKLISTKFLHNTKSPLHQDPPR